MKKWQRLNPDAYSAYIDWHMFNTYWRIKHKAINHPRRERLMVRMALARLGLRYCEAVAIINSVSYKGSVEGQTRGLQVLDFVVQRPDKKIMVLLFHPYTGHGLKPRERWLFQSKKKYLERRGTPYRVLKRNETSQMCEMIIRRLLLQPPERKQHE